jgi:hypothetical protein
MVIVPTCNEVTTDRPLDVCFEMFLGTMSFNTIEERHNLQQFASRAFVDQVDLDSSQLPSVQNGGDP